MHCDTPDFYGISYSPEAWADYTANGSSHRGIND